MGKAVNVKARVLRLGAFLMLMFAANSLFATPNWTNDGAFQRDNGLRGELILNGTWRWQPWQEGTTRPEADAWLLRNVPGWNKLQFFIRDGNGKVVNGWKGKNITGVERCWQEREFTVPAAWSGRKVFIEFYSALGKSEVYLDGQELGRLLQF